MAFINKMPLIGILLILTMSEAGILQQLCVPGCQCVPNTRMSCTNQQLNEIPEMNNINNTITYLDLSRNNLSAVSARQFELFPLLENLHLGSNHITSVDTFGFVGMDNLKKIHLENNYLRRLPRHVFSSNPSLSSVYLGRNNLDIAELSLFSDTVTHLDLSNNHLTYLPTNVFGGLKQLKTLVLIHNSLEHLSYDFFDNLQRLKLVYLYGNPWRCGGAMEELMLSKQELIADHKKIHCVTSDGEQQVWSQGSWKPATTSSETSSKQTSQSVVVKSTTAAPHVDITGTSPRVVVKSTTAAPHVDITGTSTSVVVKSTTAAPHMDITGTRQQDINDLGIDDANTKSNEEVPQLLREDSMSYLFIGLIAVVVILIMVVIFLILRQFGYLRCIKINQWVNDYQQV